MLMDGWRGLWNRRLRDRRIRLRVKVGYEQGMSTKCV